MEIDEDYSEQAYLADLLAGRVHQEPVWAEDPQNPHEKIRCVRLASHEQWCKRKRVLNRLRKFLQQDRKRRKK